MAATIIRQLTQRYGYLAGQAFQLEAPAREHMLRALADQMRRDWVDSGASHVTVRKAGVLAGASGRGEPSSF